MTPLLAAQGEPMIAVATVGGDMREQSPTPGWSMSRNAQTQILYINRRIDACLRVILGQMETEAAALPAPQRSATLSALRRGKTYKTSTLLASALARWAADIAAGKITPKARLDRYVLEYLLLTHLESGRQTEAYLGDDAWADFATIVDHLIQQGTVPLIKSPGHARQGNGRLVAALAIVKYADEIRPLSPYPTLFADE